MNWLGALTLHEGLEKAEFVYLQRDPGHLIYPSKPSTGTEHEAYIHQGRNPRRYFPLLRAHGHIDLSCFSMRDLMRLMCDNKALFEGVATSTANYLLHRTDQTSQQDVQTVRTKVNDIHDLIIKNQIAYFDEIVSQHPNQIPPEDREIAVNCITAKGKERFGRDQFTYRATFRDTMSVAQVYKLGFYVSERNGNYKLFTDDHLKAIEKQVDETIILGLATYLALRNEPQYSERYRRIKLQLAKSHRKPS